MPAPRVFLVRHGETEWTKTGQYTGVSDIPLTAKGEERIRATARAVVGDGRLIVPEKLAHVYVSPRTRAQRTFELLNLDLPEPLPWKAHGKDEGKLACDATIEVNEDCREWDYGEYDGLTGSQIRELRVSQGLGSDWDIWRDGCPGGESPAQITARLDRLIKDIRDKYHAPVLAEMENDADEFCGDVLIVAHGHMLRALARRWTGQGLDDGPAFLVDVGGIGSLSYAYNDINKPAIVLAGAVY